MLPTTNTATNFTSHHHVHHKLINYVLTLVKGSKLHYICLTIQLSFAKTSKKKGTCACTSPPVQLEGTWQYLPLHMHRYTIGHDSAVEHLKLTITLLHGKHGPHACEQSGKLDPIAYMSITRFCFASFCTTMYYQHNACRNCIFIYFFVFFYGGATIPQTMSVDCLAGVQHLRELEHG